MGGYALYARDGKRLWALPNAGPEANVTGECVWVCRVRRYGGGRWGKVGR